MKKQTSTRTAIDQGGKTASGWYAFLLRQCWAAALLLLSLAAQAQTSTVTGGNCVDCDASITVKFIDCSCVDISACKDLSNVVIRTANGVDKKYDGLSGKTGSFCTTNGSPIVKVWVKAGCYQSGDGPGYGHRFDNPNTCAGPCSLLGGDNDNDGVCNADDCQMNNPDFPAAPGTPCDDGNPNTVNDVVQPGGCSCGGSTPPPPVVTGGNCTGCDASMTVKFLDCYCVEVSSCKDLSNVVIRTENGTDKKFDGLTGKTGTFCSTNGSPIVVVWVKSGCFLSGDGTGYGRKFTSPLNCNDVCAGQGGDSDNDNVCDAQDCEPNDPAYPTTPGILCDDNDPNTINDKVTADGCGCEGTPVVVCENVAFGGAIGFGPNCNAAVQYCPTTESAPTISNCTTPIGGTGPLEVVWLKSTTSCTWPTTTAAEIAAGLDPHWRMVPGATELSYNPGAITEPTCFLRCVRRVGCSVFIESNIVSLGISPNCGGGNVPDCSKISITGGIGSITVGGIDQAPVASIQVFDANWQPKFSCYGDCQAPATVIPVSAGTYFVKVNYFTEAYRLVCEENRTLNIVSALQASLSEALQFGAVKHEAHVELIWRNLSTDQLVEYVVEKSVNGIDFVQIGEAHDGGSSLYEHYDLEPSKGDNFYRLKLVGADGSVHYTATKLVNFPHIHDYTLFPNPANSFVNINMEGLEGAEDLSIGIFNNLGIQVKQVRLEEVFGTSYQLDVRDLQEGQYVVWIGVEGKRPVAKKMMIGRL